MVWVKNERCVNIIKIILLLEILFVDFQAAIFYFTKLAEFDKTVDPIYNHLFNK